MTPRIWYLRVNATQAVDSAFATIPVDLGYLQTVAQDTEVNLLYLTVVQNGEVMSFPSNAYVEVKVDKPDATEWISTGEILESGQIKVNLPYQAVVALGVAHVNVKIFTDTQILTIPPFQIRIILDPNDGTNGDIESASEYPILTGLINAVQSAGTVSQNMLVWEVYNNTKQYKVGNKVSYLGSSYYVKTDPPIGTLPTNTTYYELIASKGDKGEKGDQGIQGIQGIQGLQGDSVEYLWNGTQLGIRIEGDAAYTYVDLKGEQGIQGITGATGNGIASVVRTSGTGAAGTTDTYTITFTDLTTTTFNVYNGADGLGAGDMLKSVYDTDGDGKVNSAVNADTVNGKTVETNVPSGAVFTDTVYTHPSTHSADIIVDGTTNKAYTATEKTKLAGIEAGAEVNNPIANNLTTTVPGSALDATQGKVINDSLAAHQAESVNSLGVHGLRYYNDVLSYYNGTTWIEIKTGSGGVAPGNVSGINIAPGSGVLKIKFTDPDDASWAGTKVVMKAGSYPNNEGDGTVILDNTTKNAYSANPFTQSGLTNGTTYYFGFFPYSADGAVNYNVVNRGTGTPVAYRTMGITIDLANSNPATCLTYTDDAVGMTAASAAWDDFFGHKPCLFKDGAVVGYLNPNNFAQFADGSAADITSGNAGDVMIEFPRRGLSISTSGDIVTIKMTDNPDDANFEYNAHTRGVTAKDKFYLGAYKGNNVSSKLRSLSGKAPTATQTIGTFRTWAQANGTGYENSGFYQLIFRQCMYILKYKNLNSQVALGRGYVTGNTAAIATGGTNAKGMDFGEDTGKLQMKLFGIEDFWGNIWEWIDGLVTNASRNMLTANSSFNDTGSGYTNNGQGATANIGNYMSKPHGGTKTGFIAKEVSGSETTYFCDYATLYASCVACYGGAWNYASGVGVFRLDVIYPASSSIANLAARLMYL